MKKIAGLALVGYVMFNSLPALGQTYAESALLFSRVRPGGSARIQSMGGAQVSLGGDYSSAVSNPAGLGMYNRSEFTFSPGMNFNSTNSSYLGTTTPASKSMFEVPGLSLVLHSDKEGQMGFLGGSFAVTFNRLNDFNRSFSYSGNNSKNSIIDYFLQDATGYPSSTLVQGGDYANTPTALAYNNFLIDDSTAVDPNASNTSYVSVLQTFPNDPTDIRRVHQKEDVQTSGAQNQWSFSYGANFSDKVFIGAGLGLTSIRYQSKKTYTESGYSFDLDPTFKPVDNMVLTENLKTNGSGINGSLGIIVRPIDAVQLGFSYITPTLYSLTDNYSATMTSQWNHFDYYGDGSKYFDNQGAQTDIVVSDYSLTTPSRISLGGSFFIAKSGFITADVEFVNYSGAKYSNSTSGISYQTDNDKIKSLYQSTTNYRLGGEFRLSNFRFRGGYSYMTDPFKTTQNGVSGQVSSLSGGAGYRTKDFYIDLALVYTQGNSSYRPYTINSYDSPLVTQTNKNSLVMLTVGFPFQ